MGVTFEEAGLPKQAPRPAAPRRAAPAKKGTPAVTKPSELKLNPWTTQFRLGYSGGIPSPIWKESHGFQIEGMFKYAYGRNRFGLGINVDHRTVLYPVSATDNRSRVKGYIITVSAIIQRETYRFPWLSTSSTFLIGGGTWTVPKHTVTTADVGSKDYPRQVVRGGPVLTSRTDFNFHVIPNWLTISPFFGIRVDEPKAFEFTGMSLLLGLNISLSLGPKPTQTLDLNKKQKPNWFVFGHDMLSQILKLVHSSYTIRPSNDYEVIQRSIDLGTGEPGNLTYLPPIKLLNGVLSMYNHGVARDRFFLYEDWRRYAMPLAEAAGAAYLFTPREGISGGTAGRTVGFSSLFNAGSTLAFTHLRTSMQRNKMSDKKRIKEARAALVGSFAINLAGSLLGGGLIARGVNTENSRGLLIGATLSQGGAVFSSIPGIPSRTSVEYMALYHFGSGGSGPLGGVKIRRSYPTLNTGVEVIVADPMLVGAHKKNGKFVTKPSFVCVSPGFQIDKKSWYFHIGPRQCFREGGSDHKVGSIGAQISIGGRIPLGKITGREISLTGSLTLGGDWLFGNVEGSKAPNNAGSGMAGVSVGFEF